jgi:hypothetical protein
MVRKTQIKKKKSKSQLRKTLKHYSKTNKNKKGGGWRRKKGNQTMTAPHVNKNGVYKIPLIPNQFSYQDSNDNEKDSPIRHNPLYNGEKENNGKGSLPSGFSVNPQIYNNRQSINLKGRKPNGASNA